MPLNKPRTRIVFKPEVNVVAPMIKSGTKTADQPERQHQQQQTGVKNVDQDIPIGDQDPAIAQSIPCHFVNFIQVVRDEKNCDTEPIVGKQNVPARVATGSNGPASGPLSPFLSSPNQTMASNESTCSGSTTSSSSKSRLERKTESILLAMDGKSPISQLQEVCALHAVGLPFYTEVGQVGPPHDRVFMISVEVAGLTAEGKGSTKKEAKTEAARAALHLLRNESRKSAAGTNSMTLMDVLDGNVNLTEPAVNGLKHLQPIAADNGLKRLQQAISNVSNGMDRLSVTSDSPASKSDLSVASKESPAVDVLSVQQLHQYCGRNGYYNPEYEELSCEGPSHDPTFTIRVTLRNLNLSATASARSKLAAKRAAASSLLSQLRQRKLTE